ncbi:DUF4190 domain-containing protein [Streptomyces sp. NPDC052236]|uniref:DUF4190 domain-containing protein n=1 Tax=Streptomyces sp. NPDC052236 TaxID=3365686 RepID=UPI0037D0B2B1
MRSTGVVDPSNQGWQQYPQYPPYQYPQPAPRPAVNGLSIAALVLGIVCCLPPLGLILGLVSLSQIKKRGERGKGMAVTGIVLSSISTVLVALALATGGVGDAWGGFKEGMDEASRSRGILDLRKGDCYNIPGSVELESETTAVEIVDCAGKHEAEVAGTFKVSGYDSYPGEDRMDVVAEKRCVEINDAYSMDPWALPKEAEIYYYLPTKESWRLGDHAVTCSFASDTDSVKLQGSVRHDATNLDAHQLAYLKAELAVFNAEAGGPDGEFVAEADAYRAWARTTSLALGAQAQGLRTHAWAADTVAPVTARTKEYDRARAHWDKAARAKDEDTFWDHIYDAQSALAQKTEISVRGPLGLTVTPPPEEEDA